jgi:hypothetical protein
MMSEEKLVQNDNDAVFASVDKEKEAWMIRLESHIRATEESEKSVFKRDQAYLASTPSGAAVYEKIQADPERQQLQGLHRQSYQVLEHTLREGRTKFLNMGKSVITLVEDYQARIQTLEAQTKQYQEEVCEIKGKQKRLIEDSLVLFARHEEQLEGLLQQLEKEPTIKKGSLQTCRNQLTDANHKAKDLKKESAKKALNTDLCNIYLIDAGKVYQSCYASIIQLIDQQAIAAKQSDSAAGSAVKAGDIGADGANVNAGGNVHVGHQTTINNIYQVAIKEMSEVIEAQKKFDEVRSQYDELQRNYKTKEEELASSQEALRHHQAGWSAREQEFFEQTAKARIARTAAESQISEQREKATQQSEEIERLRYEVERLIKVSEQQEKSYAEKLAAAGLFPTSKVTHLHDGKMASTAEEKEIEVSEADKQTFFRHIARGEQDQAEAMLKKQPMLALAKGRFDDISDLRCLKKGDEFERVFQHISGWQYAIWAGDIHMCRMIKRCLLESPNAAPMIDTAKTQYREVRQGVSDFDADHHRKAFDLTPLIDALKTYVQNYAAWDDKKCKAHWCKVVGGLQKKLPAHVINEYCRPDRAFMVNEEPPDFLDLTLPRMGYKDGRDEYGLDWFLTKVYDNGKMGDSWACARVTCCTGGNALGSAREFHAVTDAKALDRLKNVRTQQIEDELQNDLETCMRAGGRPGI